MSKVHWPCPRVDRGGDWLCVHDASECFTFLYRRLEAGVMSGYAIYVDDWMAGQNETVNTLPSTSLRLLQPSQAASYHRCWFAIALSV